MSDVKTTCLNCNNEYYCFEGFTPKKQKRITTDQNDNSGR